MNYLSIDVMTCGPEGEQCENQDHRGGNDERELVAEDNLSALGCSVAVEKLGTGNPCVD